MQVHDHRAVLAGLGLVDGELAGAVVAELLAYAFPVHKGEAVTQHPASVPVPQNPVPLAVFPEGLVCKPAA